MVKKLLDEFGFLKGTKEGKIDIIHPEKCMDIQVDLVFFGGSPQKCYGICTFLP